MLNSSKKKSVVTKKVQGLWIGQTVFTGQDNFRAISRIIHVKAKTSTSATIKILRIARVKYPGSSDHRMYDTILGKPGPYSVWVSDIQ